MTYNELVKRINEMLPEAEVLCDDDGQVVIYTCLKPASPLQLEDNADWMNSELQYFED